MEGYSHEGEVCCFGDGEGNVTMLATAADGRNGHGIWVELFVEELGLLVGCLKERELRMGGLV